MTTLQLRPPKPTPVAQLVAMKRKSYACLGANCTDVFKYYKDARTHMTTCPHMDPAHTKWPANDSSGKAREIVIKFLEEQEEEQNNRRKSNETKDQEPPTTAAVLKTAATMVLVPPKTEVHTETEAPVQPNEPQAMRAPTERTNNPTYTMPPKKYSEVSTLDNKMDPKLQQQGASYVSFNTVAQKQATTDNLVMTATPKSSVPTLHPGAQNLGITNRAPPRKLGGVDKEEAKAHVASQGTVLDKRCHDNAPHLTLLRNNSSTKAATGLQSKCDSLKLQSDEEKVKADATAATDFLTKHDESSTKQEFASSNLTPFQFRTDHDERGMEDVISTSVFPHLSPIVIDYSTLNVKSPTFCQERQGSSAGPEDSFVDLIHFHDFWFSGGEAHDMRGEENPANIASEGSRSNMVQGDDYDVLDVMSEHADCFHADEHIPSACSLPAAVDKA